MDALLGGVIGGVEGYQVQNPPSPMPPVCCKSHFTDASCDVNCFSLVGRRSWQTTAAHVFGDATIAGQAMGGLSRTKGENAYAIGGKG